MGFARSLRKLQDIYTKHKLICTIFSCLLVITLSFYYTFYASGYLSNVFVTNNVQDPKNLIATTFHYITFIAQVEVFAVLGISAFYLLVPLVEILASRKKIDPEAELSFKKLVLLLTKSSRSLLFTWFFVRVFKLGYVFLGVLFFVFHEQYSKLCLWELPNIGTTLLVSGGVVLFAYLAIYGNLGVEVSAREGISGMDALRKASELVEGKRKLIAFLLNLVLGVVSLGLFVSYEYLNTCSKGSVDKFVMLYLWQGINQVEFYTWGCFSILYFVCKKSRGESATFQPQGSLQRIMVEDELPLVSNAST